MLRRRKWGLVGAGLLVSNLVGCEIGVNATQNKSDSPDVPSTPSTPGDETQQHTAKPDEMDPTQLSPEAPPPLTMPAAGVQAESEMISASGGQVVTRSAGVNVPEGAVESGVQLTVAEVSEKEIAAPVPVVLTTVAPATAFTPHGTMFEKPVTLSLFYEAKADTNLMVMRLDNEKDTSWERVPARFVGGVAYFETTHFSVFTVATCAADVPDPLGICMDLVSGQKDVDDLPMMLLQPFEAPDDFGDGLPDEGGNSGGGSSGSSGGSTNGTGTNSGSTGSQTGGTTGSDNTGSTGSTTGGSTGSATTGGGSSSGSTGGSSGTTGGVVEPNTGGAVGGTGGGGDDNNGTVGEPDCSEICSPVSNDQVLYQRCLSSCEGQVEPDPDPCLSGCEALKDNQEAYMACAAQCQGGEEPTDPPADDCESLCHQVSDEEAHATCLATCQGDQEPPPVSLPTLTECMALLLSDTCESSSDANCAVCAMTVGACGSGNDAGEGTNDVDCSSLQFCVSDCTPDSTDEACARCAETVAKCLPIGEGDSAGEPMDADGGVGMGEPGPTCLETDCASACASATSPQDASEECVSCMTRCTTSETALPPPDTFEPDAGDLPADPPTSSCVDVACSELCAGATPETASQECLACMQKCMTSEEPVPGQLEMDSDAGVPDPSSSCADVACSELCAGATPETASPECLECMQKCAGSNELPGGDVDAGGAPTGAMDCAQVCGDMCVDPQSQGCTDCMTKCQTADDVPAEPTCLEGQRLCGGNCIAVEELCLNDCMYLLPKCSSQELQTLCQNNPEAEECKTCETVEAACPNLCFSAGGELQPCATAEEGDAGVDQGAGEGGGDGAGEVPTSCSLDCAQREVCGRSEAVEFCSAHADSAACQYCQALTAACESSDPPAGDDPGPTDPPDSEDPPPSDPPVSEDPCMMYDACTAPEMETQCQSMSNPECEACAAVISLCATSTDPQEPPSEDPGPTDPPGSEDPVPTDPPVSEDPCALYDACTQMQCQNVSDPECEACAAVISLCATSSDPQDPPAEEPAPTDPPAEEPAPTDPPAEEPAPTDPPAEEPAPTDPPAEEPAPTDPPAEEPAPTDPPVEEPAPTDPPAEEPAPTDPPAEEPAPTDPPATEPAPTDPPAEEPAPTDPPATEPAPTDPPAEEPAPTDPPATEPAPTDPPAEEPAPPPV